MNIPKFTENVDDGGRGGEVNSVVRVAGRVTATWTHPLADLKRASKPIATLMTSNVQVTSTSRRDPHSPSGA
jgi:hypothetical protein